MMGAMQDSILELTQSDYIRSVRFLEQTGGLPAHMAEASRTLRPDEIRHLEHQQNTCADWAKIRVSNDFRVHRVLGNHFIGRCVLGTFHDEGRLSAGVYHSTLRDSIIGDDAVVYRSPLVEDTILDRAAVVIGGRSSADCENIQEYAGCRFSNAAGNGVTITVGTGSALRDVPLCADLAGTIVQRILSDDEFAHRYAQRVADYRRFGDIPWCYLGPGAVIDNARVRGSWVGPFARIEDLADVAGSTIISTQMNPVTVRRGAIIEDSVLREGTTVSNYALVHRSAVLNGSTCRRHAAITESIVGPEALIDRVGLEHCILGPGTYDARSGDHRGTVDF